MLKKIIRLKKQNAEKKDEIIGKYRRKQANEQGESQKYGKYFVPKGESERKRMKAFGCQENCFIPTEGKRRKKYESMCRAGGGIRQKKQDMAEMYEMSDEYRCK